MKKMDEMERSIQLRSEEWGYRVALLMLCGWTLFNSWQTLAYSAKHNPLPSLILCAAVSVQSFVQMGLKQKMVEGDEEYRQPNLLLRSIILSIVVTAVILSAGTYFLVKA